MYCTGQKAIEYTGNQKNADVTDLDCDIFAAPTDEYF